MIFTRLADQLELFEKADFFEKADKILKARTDHKSTGQDELDLRNGILLGRVVYQERYIQTSRYLYERFLDGSFDPQRRHAFNKPISPSLLEDFLSAAAYSNPSISAAGARYSNMMEFKSSG